MKHRLRFLLFSTCLGVVPAGAAPFVHETDEELLLRAETEGGPVLFVVGKAEGDLRIASGDPRAPAWSGPHPVGLEGISFLHGGRIDPSPDSFGLLLGSKWGNAALVLAAADWSASEPGLEGRRIGALGTGPEAGAVLASTVPRLVLGHGLELPGRSLGEALGEAAGDFVSDHTFEHDRWLSQLATAIWREGEAPFLAGVLTEAGDPSEQFLAVLDERTVPLAEFPHPPGARWFTASIADAAVHHLIRHVPGAKGFQAEVIGFDGRDWFVDRTAKYALPEAMRQVLPLGAWPGFQLLALSADGLRIHILDFDGDGDPVPLQVLGDGETTFTALMPSAPGLFTGLEASPDRPGRSAGATQFRMDGSGQFTAIHQSALPSAPLRRFASTVLVYTHDPLVDTEGLLLHRFREGDWSTEAGIREALTGTAETFLGESEGLGLPTPFERSPLAPEARGAFVNQVSADSSVAFAAPATPGRPLTAFMDPAGGRFDGAAQVLLHASDPAAKVYYRRGEDADWRAYTSPIWIWRDTTLLVHARLDDPLQPGIQSPVRRAAFRFTLPPHRMDSSGDGVPDFVKLHYGLDPRIGPDSDGDGVSDLEEILNGTDPADPDSVPDPATRLPLDGRVAFDLLTAIESPAPDGSGPTPPAPGLRVGRAHGLGGSLLASGVMPAPGPEFPIVRLRDVEPPAAFPFVIASSIRGFDLHDLPADRPPGRKMAALVVPPPALRPSIAYETGAGSLADEAEAWRTAALAAYTGFARQEVAATVDPVNTLHLLLVERSLELLLREHGLLGEEEELTLLAFRERDGHRRPFAAGWVELLREGRRLQSLLAGDAPLPPGLPDYDLVTLAANLAGDLAMETIPGTAELMAVAAEVYRFAGAADPAEDPEWATRAPIDLLRAFIRGAPLPEGAAGPALSAGQLAAAAAAATVLVETPAPRPVATALLVWSGASDSDCTVLPRADGGGSVELRRRNGAPFRFPASFPLPPDTLVEVEGYADAEVLCGDAGLEVIRATVVAFPSTVPVDLDGNLLPDPWEEGFFGSTGLDPFASPDGSAYSALQQYFEGSDPTDPASLPAVPPADLGVPEVRIERLSDLSQRLTWSWSPEYASRIAFRLLRDPDLSGSGVVATDLVGTHLGGGQFQLDVPAADEREFFRLRMELAP